MLKEGQRKRVNLDIPLKDVHFYVIDTETTGFYPQLDDEIIAFAAAKTINATLQDFYV
jgi:DNA polymerase-3 subunit epsilon